MTRHATSPRPGRRITRGAIATAALLALAPAVFAQSGAPAPAPPAPAAPKVGAHLIGKLEGYVIRRLVEERCPDLIPTL